MRVAPSGAWVVGLSLAVACAGGHRPLSPLPPEAAPAAPEPAAPEPAAPEPAPEPQPDYTALYERLETNRILYLEGLEHAAAGQEVEGEALMGRAAEGIARDVRDCLEAAGCDRERALEVLETLLVEQSIAVKRQAARISELEALVEEQNELEREPGTAPPVVELPELDRSVSLLRGTDLREVIALNGPVRVALADWLTWLRPTLMEAYLQYQFLRDELAPIFREAGLPEALLFAMVATESGGKVHAYSRAGAAGLLQFMPRTARMYGLGVEDGFDLRLDPVAVTRAAVAYLNDRFAELNDNLEKALAAYNGGESRMARLHGSSSKASLWDPRIFYSLPQETREYVPRVLAAAWLFLHAEDYGLEWPQVSRAKTSLVLREDLSLAELAVCLGQAHNPAGWFRTLRNLNPRLEPYERVAAGTAIVVPAILVPVYEARCLEGELLARARELQDARRPEQAPFVPYVVQQGDTLAKIARKFRCVSLQGLAAINNLQPPRYLIKVGQVLKIPPC